jgi:hypothetical protein
MLTPASNYLRVFLLYQTDWTQAPDNSLTVEEKEAWAVYRQGLRDLSSNNEWPIPPGKINMLSPVPEWIDIDTKTLAHL